MRTYEAVFVFDPQVVKSKKEALVQVNKIFKPAASKIIETQAWGERSLAYPIKKKTQGWYLCLTVELDEAKLGEISKNLKLETTILRHLLIKQ
ncbi:30S ribosomal protein S6 [Patescibacteria group bacterium]|nr:30S ribosomal protein S6 [Patescibacteria group bacterium]MBU1931672.1 30S ribosomal protein S6 [Patescibacteria group bacterium]